jgi:hypothetical protein
MGINPFNGSMQKELSMVKLLLNHEDTDVNQHDQTKNRFTAYIFPILINIRHLSLLSGKYTAKPKRRHDFQVSLRQSYFQVDTFQSYDTITPP